MADAALPVRIQHTTRATADATLGRLAALLSVRRDAWGFVLQFTASQPPSFLDELRGAPGVRVRALIGDPPTTGDTSMVDVRHDALVFSDDPARLPSLFWHVSAGHRTCVHVHAIGVKADVRAASTRSDLRYFAAHRSFFLTWHLATRGEPAGDETEYSEIIVHYHDCPSDLKVAFGI